MTTRESFPGASQPGLELLDLLPLVSENFTPQLGYKLELTDILLSDIDIATDYRKHFSYLAGHDIQNEATFVYTYNALADSVDLESIKLPMTKRMEYEGKVSADSVYLQRYRDGFVKTLGLGEETMADVPVWPEEMPETAVRDLLEPYGLFSIGSGDLQGKIADTVSQAKHWAIREQQTIPLPTETADKQYQMIIVRKRSVSPNGNQHPAKERPIYADDYEISFQTITTPQPDQNKRHISEVTLLTYCSDVSPLPSFSLVEREYDRYDHPLVIDLPELSNLQQASHEPNPNDIATYVKLLQNFAA